VPLSLNLLNMDRNAVHEDFHKLAFHFPRQSMNPRRIRGDIGRRRGSDFEGRLRRIYERAKTVGEIEGELRRLREEIEDERKRCSTALGQKSESATLREKEVPPLLAA
jgi:hypothetical protein